MIVGLLAPPPTARELFKRRSERFIPALPGCYVLSTFGGVVLYVGLAKSIRARFCDHLEDPAKTANTPLGRAVFFHWTERHDIERVERTWMNIHLIEEGALPILNKVYSPTVI
jgi:hypothetical protein